LIPSPTQVVAGPIAQVNNPSRPVEDHDCLCRPFQKGLAQCFPALFRQALELHDALSVRCPKGWYRIGAGSAMSVSREAPASTPASYAAVGALGVPCVRSGRP